MSFLYNLFIKIYLSGIFFLSFFDKKARKWRKGREDLFNELSDKCGPAQEIIWFHAASLGEFEQGRPVIEALSKKKPGYKILLTFFSPSGYEVRKNYPMADFIFYLPIDTRANAARFIQVVNPKIAIFIKYEFWFNYIAELHKRQIPLFLISAIFRADQHFFRWYGSWFRKMLDRVTFFFVQDKHSQELLQSAGIKRVLISGDTRFDRVFELSRHPGTLPDIEKFIMDSKVLLLGSSWVPDEELVSNVLKKFPGLKIIIAPHEVDEGRIGRIEEKFRSYLPQRYSLISSGSESNARILIIDSIGLLSGLYQYCHIAFIGGGFGKGIHNILEALTFGKPVIFGPNYHKFREAKDILDLGGGFSITSHPELSDLIDRLLHDDKGYAIISKKCKEYIEHNKGATDIILQKILESL
jgi:3-deoxy-D-manno-octulosonic-acid transferase